MTGNIQALLGSRRGGGTFTPTTHTYDSAQTSVTESIPSGAAHVVIEVWGPGGSGGHSVPCGTPSGGASGAYVKKTFALVSTDWGKTFTWTNSAGGAAVSSNGANGNPGAAASTVVNGTFGTSTNLSAGPGGAGIAAGTAATGGTASGGDTNTNGVNSVVNTITGKGSPNGGGDVGAATTGSTPGGGGGGRSTIGASGAGSNGRVQFSYT